MRWWWLTLVAGCSDDWKEPIERYDVLVCRYEAQCAESAAGLDCGAYADQLVVKADPCTTWDSYYMDACLAQLEALVVVVEEDPADCPASREEEAPACGQAFTAVSGAGCP